MNNVWTTIALRTPCAARPARSRPLLELFNGHARRQGTRWIHPGSREPRIRRTEGNTLRCDGDRRCFSATKWLSERRKRPPPPREHGSKDEVRSQYPATPVKEPRRVASHTEGLDPAEQDEEVALTWRDYDPTGGIPLPDGELTQPQINAVFHSEDVDVDTGNYILSVLHWRRLSGALIDQQLAFPRDSGVSREQAARGLQYLRDVMPDVDEESNGQRWVEEENQRLQVQLQERAVKLKLYKPSESEFEDEHETAVEQTPSSDQGTPEGRARNEESVLETTRKANEAAYALEQEAKRLADARAETAALHARRGPLELGAGVQPDTALILYGPGGIAVGAPPRKAWLQPVERKPWVKYYEERAQILKDNSVPQLSLASRLLPSLAVLLLVLAAAAFLAENYTPPPTPARLWPDLPPSVATLTALTGTLLLAFAANRIPPLWRTYSKFFTLVPAYPYATSILGATFRHDTLTHLATNTATLWLMGLLLHEDVGRGAFLAIFAASGAVGGFTSLTYLVLRKQWAAYVFGCSGAVLGVASAVCTLRPHGKVSVAGYEIPIAAWIYLAVWGGLEVFAALKVPRLGVDHAGHVGGLIGGVACALWLRAKERKSATEDKTGEGEGVQMVRIEGS